ncbi:hypothetical protein [Streptomyces sp. NPDC005538]|uniref:hypothetical protein n=1 Tax=Streptomyces sp. NPDC005538 TaxID=3157043 RepID=UPI00339EA52C
MPLPQMGTAGSGVRRGRRDVLATEVREVVPGLHLDDRHVLLNAPSLRREQPEITAPAHSALVSPTGLEALALLAHGADERVLRDQGVYLTCSEARRDVAALGRTLAGGAPVRWTRIVHLAVENDLVLVNRTADVDLPPWQLDLLRAWASGLSLTQYEYKANLSQLEAKELEQLLHHSLGARSDQHAVLRGHETGNLTVGEPLTVVFHGGEGLA